MTTGDQLHTECLGENVVDLTGIMLDHSCPACTHAAILHSRNGGCSMCALMQSHIEFMQRYAQDREEEIEEEP